MDLERARVAIDGALEGCLAAELGGVEERVGAPIRHAVLAPGKRIRPLLVVAAWEATGRAVPPEEGDPLYLLACGPELVHAYSLIHDDLPCMDDDDLRRGRPSLHVEFGVRPAILAGAALMPLAVRCVGCAGVGLGLSEDVTGRLIGTLTRASGGSGMVGGQLLDLEAEGRPIEASELERIHLGKTARLISACCAMGGMAAAGSEDDVRRLSEYGLALGLAFQAVDDILDVTGTARRMGKAGGRDRALEKATGPSVLGLDGARRRAGELGREALERIGPFPRADGLRRIARLVLERDR